MRYEVSDSLLLGSVKGGKVQRKADTAHAKVCS